MESKAQNSMSLDQVKNEIIKIVENLYLTLATVDTVEHLKYKQGCLQAYEFVLESLEKIK